MSEISSEYAEVIPGLFIGSYKVASDRDTLSTLGIKAIVNVCQLEPCFTDKIKILHRNVKDCPESGSLKDSKGRYWAEECAEFIEENLHVTDGVDSSKKGLRVSSSGKNLSIDDDSLKRSSKGRITKYALTFDGDTFVSGKEVPFPVKTEVEKSTKTSTGKESTEDSKGKPLSSVLVHCRMGVSRSAACILYYLMTRKKMTLKEAYTLLLSKRPIISPNIGFMEYLSSIDEGKTFTVREYSLQALSRVFPSVDKKEIESRYDLASTMKIFLYEDLLKKGYEPYGYHAINLLLKDFPDAFQELPGRTVHEPFE